MYVKLTLLEALKPLQPSDKDGKQTVPRHDGRDGYKYQPKFSFVTVIFKFCRIMWLLWASCKTLWCCSLIMKKKKKITQPDSSWNRVIKYVPLQVQTPLIRPRWVVLMAPSAPSHQSCPHTDGFTKAQQIWFRPSSAWIIIDPLQSWYCSILPSTSLWHRGLCSSSLYLLKERY